MKQAFKHLQISWGIIFLATLIVLIIYIPTPERMVGDSDWAVQLAGASQMFGGELPFRDYPSAYGPLIFITTAFGQWLSNDRIISELLIVLTGYIIGYLLIFKMAKSISQNTIIAGLMVLLGFMLMPPMYKYYIVLWPALSLFTCWVYINKKSYKSILLIGLVTALAGLFRPDFGAYSLGATVFTIMISQSLSYRQRTIHILSLFVFTVFCALPILVWLLANGALYEYLYDSTVRTVNLTSNLALPFPAWNPNIFHPNNLFLITMIISTLISIITVMASFSNYLSAEEKAKFRVTALWAQLLLIQAFHRSDFSHFQQGFTLILIALAALLGLSLRIRNNKKSRVHNLLFISLIGIVSFIFMTAFVSPSFRGRVSQFVHNPSLEKFNTYMLTRDKFIDVVTENSENPILQAAYLIHQCTSLEDKIATGPNLINLYFMTDRRFLGKMWIAYPNVLEPQEELDTINAYEREGRPHVFVYKSNFQYDGMLERDPSVYLPNLYTYFQENYVVVTRFEDILIAVPSENAETSTCNTQQLGDVEQIIWSNND